MWKFESGEKGGEKEFEKSDGEVCVQGVCAFKGMTSEMSDTRYEI